MMKWEMQMVLCFVFTHQFCCENMYTDDDNSKTHHLFRKLLPNFEFD